MFPKKKTLDNYQSTETVVKDNIHLSDAEDSDMFYLVRETMYKECVWNQSSTSHFRGLRLKSQGIK